MVGVVKIWGWGRKFGVGVGVGKGKKNKPVAKFDLHAIFEMLPRKIPTPLPI